MDELRRFCSNPSPAACLVFDFATPPRAPRFMAGLRPSLRVPVLAVAPARAVLRSVPALSQGSCAALLPSAAGNRRAALHGAVSRHRGCSEGFSLFISCFSV